MDLETAYYAFLAIMHLIVFPGMGSRYGAEKGRPVAGTLIALVFGLPGVLYVALMMGEGDWLS